MYSFTKNAGHAQSTAVCALQLACTCLPSEVPLLVGRSGPHLIWFLGST